MPAVEPTFSTDWFTPNIPIWEEHLAAFNGKPNLRFLEIGSFEGRSACWLLQNILTHPTSSLTCIDIFERDLSLEQRAADAGLIPPISLPPEAPIEQRFDANIHAMGADGRVRKLKGKSRELLRTLPLSSFDCIYIDGSHVAMDVLTDAILCWGLLRNDGLLIFDDYQLAMFADARDNPQTAIDAFLSVFRNAYRLLHLSWQCILRKTPALREPLLARSPIQRPSTVHPPEEPIPPSCNAAAAAHSRG